MNNKYLSFTVLSFICILLFTSCTFYATESTSKTDENNSKFVISDVENLSNYDYTKFIDSNITLNVANWGNFLSLNENDVLDVNKAFEKLTGIKINYKIYETNESLYSKLKKGSDYDIIIPSDYMIAKLIKENMLLKLDFDKIPNFKNVDIKFKNNEYDPYDEYSVPYLWGIVGLVYNKNMVDKPVNSWDILWDEEYKNNILMFNNPRDAFAVALKKAGYSLNSENKDEITKAYNLLKEQKAILQGYVMDGIFDKMGNNSSAIGVYYGGDIIKMMESNNNLDYALPKEGTNKFIDAMCIPKTSKNKEAAEMYINFMCETTVGLANCAYTRYSTPLSTTFELLDPKIRNNPLAYPSDEYIQKRTQTYIYLSDETQKLTQEYWSQLKSDNTKHQWLVIMLIFGGVTTIAVIIGIIRKKKKCE